MTETPLDFHELSFNYICQICLSEDGLRLMSGSEIKWHLSVINRARAPAPDTACEEDTKAWICFICSHLIRKCTQFYNLCQHSHYLLNVVRQSTFSSREGRPEYRRSAVSTVDIPPRDHVEGPEEKVEDVQEPVAASPASAAGEGAGTGSDGDTPLVAFARPRGGGDVKKRRKKKKKMKNGDDDLSAAEGRSRSPASAQRKEPREGFSSRMKREAEEYLVIKLTTEQVVAEAAARAREERYVRAPYRCARCVLPFNFIDVRDKHMKKHSKDNGTFKCDICSQYCPSAVSLRGHIKSHTTRYQCKVCGAVRRARQHLLEHYHTAHSARPPHYSCRHAHCPFTTTKRTVIQRHVRTVHAARAEHPCELCGRPFRTVEALRVHVMRHDKSAALACGACPRRFVYASLLRRHQRDVHERRDHYCVECDVRFKSPYNLQLHFKRAKRHRDPSSNVKGAS